MAGWLAKSEPGVYSYADLVREGRTEWDGVHNALALRYLRQMARGDAMLFYHSGDERAVVGVARIDSAPHPDPRDDRGSWSVAVRPQRALRAPISLAVLRADPELAGFVLFRMGRLSVMPVTDAQWSAILAHEPGAGSGADAITGSRAGRGRTTASRRRGSGPARRRSRASRRAAA